MKRKWSPGSQLGMGKEVSLPTQPIPASELPVDLKKRLSCNLVLEDAAASMQGFQRLIHILKSPGTSQRKQELLEVLKHLPNVMTAIKQIIQKQSQQRDSGNDNIAISNSPVNTQYFGIPMRKYHYNLIDNTSNTQEKSVHILIACSKFHEKVTYSRAETKKDVISRVTYIENEATQKSFEDCKASYRRHGIAWTEEYLFHGTDKTKVDSIFANNFNIHCAPATKRAKVRSTFLIFKLFFLYFILVNDTWDRNLYDREPFLQQILWQLSHPVQGPQTSLPRWIWSYKQLWECCSQKLV